MFAQIVSEKNTFCFLIFFNLIYISVFVKTNIIGGITELSRPGFSKTLA